MSKRNRPTKHIKFYCTTTLVLYFLQAMLPLLEKACSHDAKAPMGISRAAVVNISSILGSVAGNDIGGMYAYRCSKVRILTN